MTNRVHIDAPAGVIDIEGEKDFVEGLLAKLFPLIEEAGFGSSPQAESDSQPAEDEKSDAGTTDQKSENGEAPKKRTRKAVKRPPAGQSCPARVQILKSEGFFKEHRSAADIVERLKSKGWTHNTSQVGAATSGLFTKGEIQRTKDGDGPWLYYWDRD